MVKIWGHRRFDYAFSKSIGLSDGTLISWNTDFFSKEYEFEGNSFNGVVGSWTGVGKKCGFINIYDSQEKNLKEELWENLRKIIAADDYIWILLGDFNVVRSSDERIGSKFNVMEAFAFNRFIHSSGLIDLQFEGRRFTRFSKDGSKLSKLDRVLVNPNFCSIWRNASVEVWFVFSHTTAPIRGV